MNNNIEKIIKLHIQQIGNIENSKILEFKEGYAKLELIPTEKSLNLYGNLHGGILFSLSDIAAAISCVSYNITCVTLSSSINYIKGSSLDTIIVESKVIHKGKTTLICNVTIKNSKEQLLSQATFTMFNTGSIDNFIAIN